VEPGVGFVSQQQTVVDVLNNKLLSMFQKPAHAYGFRKNVISVMKSRYLKVTGRGTHSGDVVSGNHQYFNLLCSHSMKFLFFY
jgi:hypothetical protein